MFKQIKSRKWKGVDLIVCGKFGGICSGGNNKCRKMRGLPIKRRRNKSKFERDMVK